MRKRGCRLRRSSRHSNEPFAELLRISRQSPELSAQQAAVETNPYRHAGKKDAQKKKGRRGAGCLVGPQAGRICRPPTWRPINLKTGGNSSAGRRPRLPHCARPACVGPGHRPTLLPTASKAARVPVVQIVSTALATKPNLRVQVVQSLEFAPCIQECATHGWHQKSGHGNVKRSSVV